MPVLRQRHARNFTTLPNELLQDQQLSCRDRGLLVWMLSKPPDWKFTHKAILQELPADGKTAILNCVKRLQEVGYLEISRSKKAGQFDKSIWTVSDTPHPQNEDMDIPHPRFPHPQNADVFLKKELTKKEKAVPALEGGRQPEIYFDPEAGEWKRRGTA